MDLSGFSEVVMEERKITEYLLNIHHPEGGTKAEFFLQHGFDLENPEEFKEKLLEHLQQHSATSKETIFGTKYIVSGRIKSPDGNAFMLRAVWMKPINEKLVKFVTAYPI